MTWTANLKRIRRFLRDPNGNIWSDSYLLNVWNDIQREVQHKTQILQEVKNVRYPPQYHETYLYDWEWAYLDSTLSQFYQAFRYHHQSNVVITYEWETQNLNGINSSTSEYGAHFTHPWEAAYINPGEVIKIRFPSNFHTAIYMAYDKEPIHHHEERQIACSDQNYKTRTGDPFAYYRPDNLDNSFVMFPRPTVTNWLDGDGMVLFVENDVVDAEVGDILVRTNTSVDNYVGISIDLIESDDNVTMIYDVLPDDLVTSLDECDFPDYMQKYLEFGVLERAFKANTDGRIQSLAEYWGYRYEIGVEMIKKFKRQRLKDRVYQLRTEDQRPKRNLRHARLPDAYPAI